MIDLGEQHVPLSKKLAQLLVRGLQVVRSLRYAPLQLGGEGPKLVFGIVAARDVEVGEKVMGDTPLAIAQRTGEQHRPERFAVLPILEDLDRIVAPLVDGGLVLPNCISVGLLAIHEMRVLPEQLVLGVAGQLDEGPICEDDRVAGQGASVTSIGIRVRRTASTNTPPCSRTFSMWRS